MFWLRDGCLSSTKSKCDLVMSDEELSYLKTQMTIHCTEIISVTTKSKTQGNSTNSLKVEAVDPVLISRNGNSDLPNKYDNLHNVRPHY